MNIFNGLEAAVKTDYALAKHTWYGIGGPADYFIQPQNSDQLADVITRCQDNGVKVHVIGFGSNLLIHDEGVRGAVVKLDSDAFTQSEFKDQHVTAWAGAELSGLVLTCVKRGLAGIEMLTGIPGSMGGAVRMNAGGSFGDIGSVVESVTLMDKVGNVFTKAKPELAFDYRFTNITAQFILNATLKLREDDPEQIMRTLQETWIHKKNNQPLNTRSCGCVFKNPPGQSAGALIDRAGLKGLQVGGAKVSDKHANFIVAQKGCKSVDVMRLVDAIGERVKEQFDIELEPEIEIWE
jgi:UDP-N-acetylmuramate dehydrogenase